MLALNAPSFDCRLRLRRRRRRRCRDENAKLDQGVSRASPSNAFIENLFDLNSRFLRD